MNALARFRRLDRDRQWLLAEAATNLLLVSTMLALIPFGRAIRFGAVRLRARRRVVDGDDFAWAIESAARRLPVRTKCIEKGIALQRMLRRRGADARLHYGARTDPSTGQLEAHVWVTLGSRVVIGGPESAGFAELAVYP